MNRAVLNLGLVLFILLFVGFCLLNDSETLNLNESEVIEKVQVEFDQNTLTVNDYSKFNNEQIHYERSDQEKIVNLSSNTINYPSNFPKVHRNGISFVPTSLRWKRPLTNFYKAITFSFYRVFGKYKSEQSLLTFFPYKHKLPVFSIHVNTNDFFGYFEGIYVLGETYQTEKRKGRDLRMWDEPANYHKRGAKWEKECVFQYYEQGEKKYESKGGIRVHGNATRSFPQKSVLIKGRKKYGEGRFKYDFFSGERVKKFDKLLLRNGGNDNNRTMLADAFMQSVGEDLGLITQAYQPVVVYLNNEYWGLHNLRTKLDVKYLSERMSTKEKNLLIIEGNGELYDGEKKFLPAYKTLSTLIRSKDIKKINEVIDVQEFFSYVFLQTYFANTDWPQNNVRLLYNQKEDRWSFLVFDLDYGCGYIGENAFKIDAFEHLKKKKGVISDLFFTLVQDNELKTEFIRMAEEFINLQANKEILIQRLENMVQEIEGEVDMEINRWQNIVSKDVWLSNIQNMKNFIEKRESIYLNQVNNL